MLESIFFPCGKQYLKVTVILSSGQIFLGSMTSLSQSHCLDPFIQAQPRGTELEDLPYSCNSVSDSWGMLLVDGGLIHSRILSAKGSCSYILCHTKSVGNLPWLLQKWRKMVILAIIVKIALWFIIITPFMKLMPCIIHIHGFAHPSVNCSVYTLCSHPTLYFMTSQSPGHSK